MTEISKWINHLTKNPVSIFPLIVFRISFGLILFISTLRFIIKGWVTGEIEKGFTFRSYIKKLNVFELNPQETGDLILCLLLQRVIVENNEDESVQKKYMEDIESICNDQLEGQSIYNDSLEMANKIYQEYRSQSKH